MRILRLRVESFRGIAARTIEPLETGVTLVVGPNEAGKSSLAEALHLLLEVPASSGAKKVRDTQPIGRDVGVEIELEARVGRDRVVYRKRYLRDRETFLEVTPGAAGGEPRSWTGREAHDRMRALLEETMDLDLWRALAIEQGEHAAPEGIGSASSLSAALDRAAGGQAAGAEEESLFERAAAALAEWFTPTGREKRELQRLAEEVDERSAEAEKLSERLRRLDDDVGRVELLGERIGKLEIEAEAAATEAAERRAECRAAESLETEVEALRRAAGDAFGRRRLLDERRKAERERGEARAALAPRRDEVAAAAAEHERWTAERERLVEALASAEEELALGRRDEDHLAALRDQEAAGAALTEASSATERVVDLRRRLASFGLDAELLERIETAERSVAAKVAALELASPTVRAEAEAELLLQERTVEGGETEADEAAVVERKLVAGESIEHRLSGRLSWRLPKLLHIAVEPGAGVAELSRELAAARGEVERLCARAGVASPDEARRRMKERRALGEELRAAEAAVAAALGGRSRERLAEEVERGAAEIAAYREARRAEPPLPEGLETARQRRRELEAGVEELRRKARSAERRAAAAEERWHAAARAERVAELDLANAEERLRWVDGQLAPELLAAIEEGRIDELMTVADRAVDETRRGLAAGELRLVEVDTGRLEKQAVAAEGAARRLADELARDRRERRDLEVRLETLGEQGLFERREEAEARLAEAIRARDGARRAASAARRLYDTLAEERDAARAGYRGPLAEKIGELGRDLFGEDFAVEVDEELRLVRRTAAGVTLSVDQLSIGAQEQLSLLTRVACALLVAEDGGVPLILDDTLGHADPERTAAMARVLEEAGRSCQVIVLTASPARFAAVESARRIDLAEPAAAAPAAG